MSKNNLDSFPIVDETSEYDLNLMINKAKGNYIWFEGHKKPYFDLTMGYSSTNFGHNNPEIIGIVKTALQKADNVPAFNFRERISLSNQILNYLPFTTNDYQTYYPVGGAKAVEAALKLARLYTQRTTIISFKGAFHGYSISAMGVTDQHFFSSANCIFKHVLFIWISQILIKVINIRMFSINYVIP